MKHTDDTYNNFDRARQQHAQDMAVSGEPAAPKVYVPAVGEWVTIKNEEDRDTAARAGIDEMRDETGQRHYRAWGRYGDEEAYMSPVYESFDDADTAPANINRLSDIPLRDAEVAAAAVARSRMNPDIQASRGDMEARMIEAMIAAKRLYAQHRREEAEADRRAAFDREALRLGAYIERYYELKAVHPTPAPEVQQ
jgi:hypothetical protein